MKLKTKLLTILTAAVMITSAAAPSLTEAYAEEISTGNIRERFPHNREIRFALICLLLSFAELGCRHQLHSLSDLHGVLNAFDPEFYSFHIGSCHI